MNLGLLEASTTNTPLAIFGHSHSSTLQHQNYYLVSFSGYITTFISEQIKFQGDEDTLLETNEGQVTSSSNVEHEEFSSQVLGDMLGLVG